MFRTLYIKNWLVGSLLFMLGICLHTSCSDEEVGGGSVSGQKGGITLNIKLPDPIVKNPMTRGATDFDEIRNLNIIVANGTDDASDVIGAFYYSEEDQQDQPVIDKNNQSISAHFSKEFVKENGLSSKTFFIVANNDQQLTPRDIPTVRDLRAYKDKAERGIPANGCMMFAEAENEGGQHTDEDGTSGITLKAELERTVAMITVAVDGQKLAKNVFIIPQSISVHNVPTSCTIGKPNIIEVNDKNEPISPTDISEDGESKSVSNWGTVVGGTTLAVIDNMPNLPESVYNPNTSVGKHYIDDDGRPDYSQNDVLPLFLFENQHLAGFGGDNEDEKKKLPKNVTSTNVEEITHTTRNCSYLKITAQYIKTDDTGKVLFGGMVNFKFFLGENITNDFDVKKNKYYYITLSLSGNAVTEGGQVGTNENGEPVLEANPADITWRVDSNLSNASFLTGDLNFNASGGYYGIPVAIDDNASWTIEASGNNTTFVRVYGTIYGSTGWYSLGAGMDVKPRNGMLWIFIEPLMLTGSGLPDDRSISLTLTTTVNGNSESQTMTIMQYAPLEVTVDASQPGYEFIEDVYGTKSLKLYIDKIDREEMPWGFYGIELDDNQNDAFDNVLHLAGLKGDTGGSHAAHIVEAKKYLPLGRTYTNNGNISQNGSAMIYSLMLHNNTSDNNWSNPAYTPDDLFTPGVVQFPEINYEDNSTQSSFYWAPPSIAGWQILEKLYKDSKLNGLIEPIQPFYEYWTSNTMTPDIITLKDNNGTQYSYTYQFGKGLDIWKLEEDGSTYPSYARRDLVKHVRLVAIKPEQIPH